MSSSENEVAAVKVATKKQNSKKADKKSEKPSNEDYQIKPTKGGPSMDTSTWPLLLKVRPHYNIYTANNVS